LSLPAPPPSMPSGPEPPLGSQPGIEESYQCSDRSLFLFRRHRQNLGGLKHDWTVSRSAAPSPCGVTAIRDLLVRSDAFSSCAKGRLAPGTIRNSVKVFLRSVIRGLERERDAAARAQGAWGTGSGGQGTSGPRPRHRRRRAWLVAGTTWWSCCWGPVTRRSRLRVCRPRGELKEARERCPVLVFSPVTVAAVNRQARGVLDEGVSR
jgi:hypothetical protein